MAASSSKQTIPHVYQQHPLLLDDVGPDEGARDRIVPGACAPSNEAVEKAAGQPAKSRKRKCVVNPNQLALDMSVLLTGPVIPTTCVPMQFRSAARCDKQVESPDLSGEVELVESNEVSNGIDSAIPFEAWGDIWIETHGGLTWSREGIYYLQVQLFWDSLIELTLSNNQSEKWDVFKWIFKPARRRFYYYGRPPVEWHEHDEPFSFHNCCKAVGMRPDELREWMRKRTDPEIMNAIDKVFTNY